MATAAEITKKYIFHYVYRLENPDTGNYYIGVRSSDQLPEVDPYRGSYKAWEPECEREDLKKIILAQFPSREKADSWERSMIEYHIQDPENMNGHIPNVGFSNYGTIIAAHISDPKNFKQTPLEKFHSNRDQYLTVREGKKGCWANKKRPNFSGKNHPRYGIRGADHHASKKVLHIESGVIYESQREAGEPFGLTRDGVGHHCRGKSLRPDFVFINNVDDRDQILSEMRKHNSEYDKNYTHPLKDRKNPNTAKAVKHIESGRVFRTAAKASEAFNVANSTISNHCYNNVKNPRFKFIEDSNE